MTSIPVSPNSNTTNLDSWVTVDPAKAGVEQGGSRKVTLSVAKAGDFQGSIKIDLTGLPAGVTTQPNFPFYGSISKPSFSFTVFAGSSAKLGISSLTLTASGKPVTGFPSPLHPTEMLKYTRNIPLEVLRPSGQLTTGLSPKRVTVERGKSVTVDMFVFRVGVLKKNVTLNVANVPAGLTVSPSAPVTLGPTEDKRTYTISAALSSTNGTKTIEFSATGLLYEPSTMMTYRDTLTVNVVDPPDFSIQLQPTSISIDQGGYAGPVQVTLNKQGSFKGPVDYIVTGLSGVTPTIHYDTQYNASMMFAANPDAKIGTSTASVTGTATIDDTTVRHSAPLTVVVNEGKGDFSMSLSPTSVSVERAGASKAITVAIQRTGIFKGDVTVSGTGLQGVTSILPVIIGASATSATFTVSADTSAPLGAKAMTVMGAATFHDRPLSHTANLNVTVQEQPGDFTIKLSSAKAPVEWSKSGTVDVEVARSGSFIGDVKVSASPLPNGVTSTPITIGASSTTGTLTFNAGSAASFGESSATVSATGTVNGSSKTKTVSVTIAVTHTTGDFKEVSPNYQTVGGTLTSKDNKLSAKTEDTKACAKTNINRGQFRATFQKVGSAQLAQTTFYIGPWSNLGGVAFSDASTSGVVMSGHEPADCGCPGVGFGSNYLFTLYWLVSSPLS